jgi:hypothetical protein
VNPLGTGIEVVSDLVCTRVRLSLSWHIPLLQYILERKCEFILAVEVPEKKSYAGLTRR